MYIPRKQMNIYLHTSPYILAICIGYYANTPVAIKVFKNLGKTFKPPPSTMKKIEREIYILAKCRHPNVIQFMGFDIKSWIVVTEQAVTTLYAWMYGLYEGNFQLPELSSELKMQLLCDISNGLYYLHFHDILHRDLKPQNVLLVENTSRLGFLIAKLTDFGEATVAGIY